MSNREEELDGLFGPLPPRPSGLRLGTDDAVVSLSDVQTNIGLAAARWLRIAAILQSGADDA